MRPVKLWKYPDFMSLERPCVIHAIAKGKLFNGFQLIKI